MVYGLGVGPGDPDLITVKGLRVLKNTPVIAYPATIEGESTARSIVEAHLGNGETELPLFIDISAGHAANTANYDKAAAAISAHLQAGRCVAVLCEGDPFFYGSFAYLFARLAEDWPVEVVPGVSSLTACAAALGAPLAAGGDILTVLPASLDEKVLRRRMEEADGVAIIKIGRHFAKIARVLADAGLLAKARYVERVGLNGERSLPIADVKADEAPYFSMVLAHHRQEVWK
jgi:precorrin-2/cobalt-factor-2 C20-methyltransferase